MNTRSIPGTHPNWCEPSQECLDPKPDLTGDPWPPKHFGPRTVLHSEDDATRITIGLEQYEDRDHGRREGVNHGVTVVHLDLVGTEVPMRGEVNLNADDATMLGKLLLRHARAIRGEVWTVAAAVNAETERAVLGQNGSCDTEAGVA